MHHLPEKYFFNFTTKVGVKFTLSKREDFHVVFAVVRDISGAPKL